MRKVDFNKILARGILALCGIGLFAFASCSDDSSSDEPLEVKVEKVALNTRSLSLVVGTADTLVAVVTPENSTNPALVWTSERPEVATVSETGLVTAVATGLSTVMVKTVDGEKVDVCMVTVTPEPVAVTGVTLNLTTLGLTPGGTGQLVATVLPEDATVKDMTWSSSDAGVATVSETGLVTAVDFGSATIMVTTADGNMTASCEVTVDEFGDVNLDMVEIPAGTFVMGEIAGTMGSQNDERPQHNVTISQGFQMTKYEITNRQYCIFLNKNEVGEDGMLDGQLLVQSSSAQGSDWGVNWDGEKWVSADGKEEFPVIYVTWYGAKAFAEWAGGSLPTEAQWEYAARGGAEEQLYGIGDGKSLTKGMANFNWTMELLSDGSMGTGNAASTGTLAVGSYLPNAYGLYDMHGNVWEWCADWYGAYTADAVTDPVGADSGTYRVFRGGSWNDYYFMCRSAFRNVTNVMLSFRPETGNNKVGFRIVMPL